MTDKAKAKAVEQEQEVQEAQDAQESQLDKTEPGGRYVAADGKTLVDANGEPIKSKS